MELRNLKYFVAVADTQSFTKAAEILYVSQSALSKQIAAMETELGVKLFERDKRNVTLTNAGKLLLPEAKAILLRAEKLPPLLRFANEEGERRIIHVALDPVLDAHYNIHQSITDKVFQMRYDYPGIQILFKKRAFGEMYHQLLDEEIDIGIYSRQEIYDHPELRTKLLYKEPHVLVYRSRQPLDDSLQSLIQIINKRGLIVPEKNVTSMELTLDILKKLDCIPHIRFSEDRTSMILSVISGESAALLPVSVVNRFPHPELSIIHLPEDIGTLYCFAAMRVSEENALVNMLFDELEIQ